MSVKKKTWRKSYQRFNKLYKYLTFFALITCLLSCQTLFRKKNIVPNNLSQHKIGSFSGTVLISQKKKKHYFSGDIFISGKEKLRMDLNVSFGIPVFTLLWNKKTAYFLFLRNKMFYQGPDIKSALPSFLSENLNILLFKEIFFDRKPAGKKWTCKMDKAGLPVECRDLVWLIQWKRGKKRLLTIESSEFGFIFEYFSFSSEVDNSLFTVKIPADFKAPPSLK